MKVAMYYSQRDIRLEEATIPKIERDEVLVEMKACGICGSDLMGWYLENRAPLVLGHEPTGIIVETGGEVETFDLDDRVFVHHHVACLTCHYCIHGDYTLCEKFHSTNIDPGGLSQYIRVPAPNLQIDVLKIPETLSFEEATLIEPVGCCLRALRKCVIQEGDTVTVIGAGTTGIVHAALSRLFGAAKTIVSDLVDYRLQIARKFGVEVTVNPENESFKAVIEAETDGIGADLVIVTAPSLEAYKSGLDVCRKGGKLCVFAPTIPGNYLRINPRELFFSEHQIIPSYSTSHLETRTALRLIESRRIQVGELITHRFKLADTSLAFETALKNMESLKVIVLN